MRWINRAKILWSYLRRAERLPALPVEYIVETTAKCNLYCPMCPRETHKQPKEDMPPEIFERLIAQTASTAEHMMLIGLGEPFLDPAIFDRIGSCDRHGIATLLSTNGTLLDEPTAARLLDSPLAHITLSFDGYSKETFEFYRKGANFERVRDNFVRFCRMKHARGSKLQVVVQMVRMPGNAHEAADFMNYWSRVEGVDQVRVKDDETNVLEHSSGVSAPGTAQPAARAPDPQPSAVNPASVPPMRRCHYLWRGPMYVKQDGRVYPCCQSYMLDGDPVGDLRREGLAEIVNSGPMRELRRLHGEGRGAEIDMCARCCTSIPHPLLAAGSLVLHGKWVRRALPAVERLVHGRKLPATLLERSRDELVHIHRT